MKKLRIPTNRRRNVETAKDEKGKSLRPTDDHSPEPWQEPREPPEKSKRRRKARRECTQANQKAKRLEE